MPSRSFSNELKQEFCENTNAMPLGFRCEDIKPTDDCKFHLIKG